MSFPPIMSCRETDRSSCLCVSFSFRSVVSTSCLLQNLCGVIRGLCMAVFWLLFFCSGLWCRISLAELCKSLAAVIFEYCPRICNAFSSWIWNDLLNFISTVSKISFKLLKKQACTCNCFLIALYLNTFYLLIYLILLAYSCICK